MSVQTIRAVVRPAGFDTCCQCNKYKPCGTLIIYIDHVIASEATRCWDCMKDCVVKTQLKQPHRGVQRKTLKKARAAETKTATDTGGRQTMASGSGAAKGDSRNEEFMFEDKYTEKNSFRVTKGIMNKALAQAHRSGRAPVIRVHLPDNFTMGVMYWDDLLPFVEEQ